MLRGHGPAVKISPERGALTAAASATQVSGSGSPCTRGDADVVRRDAVGVVHRAVDRIDDPRDPARTRLGRPNSSPRKPSSGRAARRRRSRMSASTSRSASSRCRRGSSWWRRDATPSRRRARASAPASRAISVASSPSSSSSVTVQAAEARGGRRRERRRFALLRGRRLASGGGCGRNEVATRRGGRCELRRRRLRRHGLRGHGLRRDRENSTRARQAACLRRRRESDIRCSRPFQSGDESAAPAAG